MDRESNSVTEMINALNVQKRSINVNAVCEWVSDIQSLILHEFPFLHKQSDA